MVRSTHLIDYRKFRAYGVDAAFGEWLAWIVCMAPYDVGIYD